MGYLGKRPVPIANGIVMPLIAAGGLFTSANDLARFVFYLMRGSADAGEQIVPQRLLQEMYAPQFTARDQMSGYGLGIYKAIQLRLDPYSANEFTRGSRRYKFLLAENGKPNGVQIFDAYYDPQTAENSVVYLPVNDMAADGPGLNKPAWSRHVGKYGGTFIGCSQRCQDLAEKRFFVLKWRTETNRSQSQFFIAADGEAVVFSDEGLSVGNKLYSKSK